MVFAPWRIHRGVRTVIAVCLAMRVRGQTQSGRRPRQWMVATVNTPTTADWSPEAGQSPEGGCRLRLR